MTERESNQLGARMHHIPSITFPYKVDEIELALEFAKNYKQVVCPSSPYMCHDADCGCRFDIRYRNVIY